MSNKTFQSLLARKEKKRSYRNSGSPESEKVVYSGKGAPSVDIAFSIFLSIVIYQWRCAISVFISLSFSLLPNVVWYWELPKWNTAPLHHHQVTALLSAPSAPHDLGAQNVPKESNLDSITFWEIVFKEIKLLEIFTWGEISTTGRF